MLDEQLVMGVSCRLFHKGAMMSKVAMMAGVLLGAGAVSAAPITIIDGTGNVVAPYSGGTNFVTYGQTVGGEGAAQVNFTGRNNEQLMTAAVPRPLLDTNRYVTAELYVATTEDTDGTTVVQQGINRMKIILRNPDDGTQDTLWIGDDPGDGADVGMGWYPVQAGAWQTFAWDLTQESWWTESYSSWEVYRIALNESAAIPNPNDSGLSNQFAIRNWQLTDVPEPGSLSLIGMGLGAMLLRRRR